MPISIKSYVSTLWNVHRE